MNNNYKATSITITYLTNVSFASLNGGDSDTDNINVIKKITSYDGKEYPYVSSQALRRAMRDQLQTLGYTLSPVSVSDEVSDEKEPGNDEEDSSDSKKKHPPVTSCNPVEYIDDDLFGYMNAQADTIKRTSAVRVSPLVALQKYMADMDFGTNYMGKDVGMDPNIFETEIHRGLYRGTILIEIDRIGTGDGFILQPKKKSKKDNGHESTTVVDKSLNQQDKYNRCIAFLDAFQNLWSTGRQSRFLADISPKFIAAALLKSKNPIFLETMSEGVDISKLEQVVTDYSRFIDQSVFASQSSFFPTGGKVVSLQEGFATIRTWLRSYYQV